MSDWNNCSVTQMRQWLLTSQPFIEFCMKTKKRQQMHNTQDIRTFLHTSAQTRLTSSLQQETKHARSTLVTNTKHLSICWTAIIH
eukprot:1005758-Ditylum_brightwellii.AAC.1